MKQLPAGGRQRPKYRLSPNEVETLKKEESERRRKLRIVQVREQSKAAAAHIRNNVQQEKKRQLLKLAQQVEGELETERQEEVRRLEQQYDNTLRTIGQAHTTATITDKEMVNADRRVTAHINDQRAKDRHREALRQAALDRAYRQYQDTRQIRDRQAALVEEKKRAAEVAARPPPPPDPIDQALLAKRSMKRPVSLTDLNAFSSTHYHIPDFAVERAPPEQQHDGKAAGEEEDLRAKEELDERRKKEYDQIVTARIRGNEALKKEKLKHEYDALMADLSLQQRADRRHRQQVVSKLPKQVFIPADRRMEELEDKQMEMERAFEDMYMKQMNLSGDLSLTLDPNPMAETPVDNSMEADDSPVIIPSMPSINPALRELTNVSHTQGQTTQQGKPETVLKQLLHKIKEQRSEVNQAAPHSAMYAQENLRVGARQQGHTEVSDTAQDLAAVRMPDPKPSADPKLDLSPLKVPGNQKPGKCRDWDLKEGGQLTTPMGPTASTTTLPDSGEAGFLHQLQHRLHAIEVQKDHLDQLMRERQQHHHDHHQHQAAYPSASRPPQLPPTSTGPQGLPPAAARQGSAQPAPGLRGGPTGDLGMRADYGLKTGQQGHPSVSSAAGGPTTLLPGTASVGWGEGGSGWGQLGGQRVLGSGRPGGQMSLGLAGYPEDSSRQSGSNALLPSSMRFPQSAPPAGGFVAGGQTTLSAAGGGGGGMNTLGANAPLGGASTIFQAGLSSFPPSSTVWHTHSRGLGLGLSQPSDSRGLGLGLSQPSDSQRLGLSQPSDIQRLGLSQHTDIRGLGLSQPSDSQRLGLSQPSDSRGLGLSQPSDSQRLGLSQHTDSRGLGLSQHTDSRGLAMSQPSMGRVVGGLHHTGVSSAGAGSAVGWAALSQPVTGVGGAVALQRPGSGMTVSGSSLAGGPRPQQQAIEEEDRVRKVRQYQQQLVEKHQDRMRALQEVRASIHARQGQSQGQATSGRWADPASLVPYTLRSSQPLQSAVSASGNTLTSASSSGVLSSGVVPGSRVWSADPVVAGSAAVIAASQASSTSALPSGSVAGQRSGRNSELDSVRRSLPFDQDMDDSFPGGPAQKETFFSGPDQRETSPGGPAQGDSSLGEEDCELSSSTERGSPVLGGHSNKSSLSGRSGVSEGSVISRLSGVSSLGGAGLALVARAEENRLSFEHRQKELQQQLAEIQCQKEALLQRYHGNQQRVTAQEETLRGKLRTTQAVLSSEGPPSGPSAPASETSAVSLGVRQSGSPVTREEGGEEGQRSNQSWASELEQFSLPNTTPPQYAVSVGSVTLEEVSITSDRSGPRERSALRSASSISSLEEMSIVSEGQGETGRLQSVTGSLESTASSRRWRSPPESGFGGRGLLKVSSSLNGAHEYSSGARGLSKMSSSLDGAPDSGRGRLDLKDLLGDGGDSGVGGATTWSQILSSQQSCSALSQDEYLPGKGEEKEVGGSPSLPAPLPPARQSADYQPHELSTILEVDTPQTTTKTSRLSPTTLREEGKAASSRRYIHFGRHVGASVEEDRDSKLSASGSSGASSDVHSVIGVRTGISRSGGETTACSGDDDTFSLRDEKRFRDNNLESSSSMKGLAGGRQLQQGGPSQEVSYASSSGQGFQSLELTLDSLTPRSVSVEDSMARRCLDFKEPADGERGGGGGAADEVLRQARQFNYDLMANLQRQSAEVFDQSSLSLSQPPAHDQSS